MSHPMFALSPPLYSPLMGRERETDRQTDRQTERETSDSPYIKTSTHLVRRVFEVLGESSYVFSQPSSLLSTPGDIVQSRVFVACGACVAMELFLF